eukprot:TRINITY_DN2232_c0_g2_i1.p1 TRINITY_DN2232_c0_g2~~TRINITY_DN2232_c0_g2_i1.p1  ORF type:complete len:376 (-),score=79.50 TRINITY_DN2232_c0_g2_i1:573-1700(-)
MASLHQPKKAVSAYWLWLRENRAKVAKQIGSLRGSEVAKAAGQIWKALPEEQKMPFQAQAAAALDDYNKAMAAFKGQGGVPATKKPKSKKEQTKNVKDKQAPKKPLAGAYGAFLAEKRDEIKQSLPAGHKITDVTKKASEMWRKVCKADKEKYQALSDVDSELYRKQLEEHKTTKSGAEAAPPPSPKKEKNCKRELASDASPSKKQRKQHRKKYSEQEIADAPPALQKIMMAADMNTNGGGTAQKVRTLLEDAAKLTSSRLALALQDAFKNHFIQNKPTVLANHLDSLVRSYDEHDWDANLAVVKKEPSDDQHCLVKQEPATHRHVKQEIGPVVAKQEPKTSTVTVKSRTVAVKSRIGNRSTRKSSIVKKKQKPQ